MEFFLIDRPKLFPALVPGEVERTISYNQPGRIKCLSSFWTAQLYQPSPNTTLCPGELVNVVGRLGITLLVVPNQKLVEEGLADESEQIP